MTKPQREHLLSFVADSTGEYVAIHLDLRGVNMLIEELQHLKKGLEENDCPHTHLMGYSPGDELTQTKLASQEIEANIVGHVKIYGWNEEWSWKHKLKTRNE